MRRSFAAILPAVLAVIFSPSNSLVAHHAFAPVYDLQTVGTLKGVVTKIVWGMPHPYIYLDVRSPEGSTANWVIEGSSVSILARDGWSPSTVKVGDVISVCGFLSKPNASAMGLPSGVNPARAMSGMIISMADGRKLTFGGGTSERCSQ